MKINLTPLLLFVTINCGGENAIQTPTTANNETILEGLWKSTCFSETNKTKKELAGTIAKIKVTKNTFSYERWSYQDTKCQGEPHYKKAISGTIKITGQSADYQGASNLEAIVSSESLKSFQVSGTDRLNQEKLCGFSDWQTGITKELIEQETCRKYKRDQAIYQIFLLNAQGQLLLGKTTDSLDGKSRETRPTTMIESLVYTNWETRIP